MEIDNDLLNEFILEAQGHLAEMEADLLQMESGENDEATINRIFRAAHSIKGTAGFFGFQPIIQLAHSIESLFGEIREQNLSVTSAMIDTLFAALDLLKKLLAAPGEESVDVAAMIQQIEGFLLPANEEETERKEETEAKSSGEATSPWDLWNQLMAAEEIEEQSEEINVPGKDDVPGEDSAEPAAEPTQPKITPVSPKRQGQDSGALKKTVAAAPSTAVPEKIKLEDTVRVNVGLLNDLLNLAGEMVLRRNQLLRLIQAGASDLDELEAVSIGIDELTTNLQKKVMKTRMQPIAHVFNKFPRIVRDLSHKIGKEVDLSLDGMNVELDRSFIEALVDPMTHLVRNALDHGIESPEIRAQRNKPPVGSLVLRAYHEGGRVVVEISDDGGGIDLAQVKAKAREKGLITEKEAALMREPDWLHLIMNPGFSTAKQVTDLSGRGVGLDVVKTNIEMLGGKIEIVTEPGAGTTFRLLLPLTLAIISALIVEADGQLFAIPQANLKESLLVQNDETGAARQIEFIQGCPVLRLRNRLIPLARLGKTLQLEDQEGQEDDQTFFAKPNQLLRILIVKSNRSVYGLIVDAVDDTEEILVKSLSPLFNGCNLYSGVTVLGDGKIALILDTEKLRLCAGIPLASEPEAQAVYQSEYGGQELQYVLLFRCSGGEMLGLDLAMVARVEVVDESRLQKIGSKYYFLFQGQTVRVIWPENYLPLGHRQKKSAKWYIILPKAVQHTIGIVAAEICDAIETSVVLDQEGVCGPGILGSALIQGNIVILLNLYELFERAAPEYYTKADAGKPLGMAKSLVRRSPLKILLVEDVPFFLRVIKSYLVSDGYEVFTAENGREALEFLEKTTVDGVISDIEMPIMNGLELVRAIRADERLKALPVIALSSLTGEAYRKKGLRAGFDVYEYKLDRTRLLTTLHDLLNGRKTEK